MPVANQDAVARFELFLGEARVAVPVVLVIIQVLVEGGLVHGKTGIDREDILAIGELRQLPGKLLERLVVLGRGAVAIDDDVTYSRRRSGVHVAVGAPHDF